MLAEGTTDEQIGGLLECYSMSASTTRSVLVLPGNSASPGPRFNVFAERIFVFLLGETSWRLACPLLHYIYLIRSRTLIAVGSKANALHRGHSRVAQRAP